MNIVFNGLSVYLPTGKTFSATNHLIPELTNKGISVFTLTKVNEQLYRLNPKSPNQTSVPQMYIYDVRYRGCCIGIEVETSFFTNLNSTREYTFFIKQSAPWMDTAFSQLGQQEIAGINKANPQILQYFKSSKFWGTDDSTAKNAWCASFAAWVMQKNGYSPPANAFRAKAWMKFGRQINSPIFGSLGIKSRSGGGHIAFVVGQSADKSSLFMLGGNQNDEVNISRYPINIWESFVVPDTYNSSRDFLPTYQSSFTHQGSES